MVLSQTNDAILLIGESNQSSSTCRSSAIWKNAVCISYIKNYEKIIFDCSLLFPHIALNQQNLD